ncbi:uncharacterized protein LODBEIA_P41880 [Lodderomyces beijingensis]|uniref:Uncharacterized protein n=1 Tax=Lodderomyces beijingensis TaxID=1775926 RepID=A0ABP0ZPX2_9ASCO
MSQSTHDVNFNLYSNSSSSVDELNSANTGPNVKTMKSSNSSSSRQAQNIAGAGVGAGVGASVSAAAAPTTSKSQSDTHVNNPARFKEDPHEIEKLHDFVRKTINKLKLSPAIRHHQSLTTPEKKNHQQPSQSSQSQSQSQAQPRLHHQSQSQQSQSQNLLAMSSPPASRHHNSVASCSSSSSDIFERSVSNNDHLTCLSNPETPIHYNIENYTSPILDTTTEILTNPNIQLDQVRLNCYCDEITLAKGNNFLYRSHTGTHTSPENSSQNSVTPADLSPPVSLSPTLRPRARSIISQSIISTLDGSKFSNHAGCKSNLSKSTPGIQLSAKQSQSQSQQLHQTAPPPPFSFFQTKRSSSFAGATPFSRSNPREVADTNGVSPAIEFYSFADMISHEDEEGLAYLHEEADDYNENKIKTKSNKTNDNNNNDDDDDDNDDDEIDPLSKPRKFASLDAHIGSGIGSIREPPPNRRGSYATISAKDYIGV